MSSRRLHLTEGQENSTFEFSPDTVKELERWAAKYPAERKQSAVIPALWIVQKQNGGWISEPSLRAVADWVGMPVIRVYEVATFYTMFNLEPVGRHHVQLCGTTPCMLRGADGLKEVCKRRIGDKGRVSEDGLLSWVEVECLGACVNAPMVQINDYYFEDLTPETLEKVLDGLVAGENPKPGTYVDRQTSGPMGGLTTLTSPELFDGSKAKPLTAIPGAPQPTAEAAKPVTSA